MSELDKVIKKLDAAKLKSFKRWCNAKSYFYLDIDKNTISTKSITWKLFSEVKEKPKWIRSDCEDQIYYIQEYIKYGQSRNITRAFCWGSTPQGDIYWSGIQLRGIDDKAKEILQDMIKQLKEYGK